MDTDRYVVTSGDIAKMTGVDKQHFVDPDAKRRNISLGDLTGLTGMGFHLIEVAPGKRSSAFHLHQFEDECVYILAGEAEATIGDRVYRVSAGDFLGFRAGGAAHALRNTGTEVLKCLVAGQRLAHDVADYPDAKKRLFRNAGMPWQLVDLTDITAITQRLPGGEPPDE